MACDENEPMVDIDLSDSEASLSKMPAAVDEFEKHTTQVRKFSRHEAETAKDSGVESLYHDSPGPEIQTASQERAIHALDPREDMTETKGEATPSRARSCRRSSAQKHKTRERSLLKWNKRQRHRLAHKRHG